LPVALNYAAAALRHAESVSERGIFRIEFLYQADEERPAPLVLANHIVPIFHFGFAVVVLLRLVDRAIDFNEGGDDDRAVRVYGIKRSPDWRDFGLRFENGSRRPPTEIVFSPKKSNCDQLTM
jgi:hypothetical protein